MNVFCAISGFNFWKPILHNSPSFFVRKANGYSHFFLKLMSVCCCKFRTRTFFTQVQSIAETFSTLLLSDMGKRKAAGGFYAVARGRSVGIYHSWDECKAQVHGFTNARFKKFVSLGEAEKFIEDSKVPCPADQSVSTATENEKSNKESNFDETSKESSSCLPSSSSSSYNFANKPTSSHLNSDKIDKSFDVQYSSSSQPSNSAPSRKRGRHKTLFEPDIPMDNFYKRSRHTGTGSSSGNSRMLSFDEDGYLIVFTDGACSSNGYDQARAGIGVYFADNHELNISQRAVGRQTNNTAEIQAAEYAMRQAQGAGYFQLNIHTDSRFLIQCVTEWLPNWKRNGWRTRTGPVRNRVDLENLEDAMNCMSIKWTHVEGHAGIKGNVEADRLAVAGSLQAP